MDEQMKPEVNAIEITDELIKANTYEIRGQKVMLDRIDKIDEPCGSVVATVWLVLCNRYKKG